MGEKKEKKDKEKKDKEKKKEEEKATVRSAPDGSDNKRLSMRKNLSIVAIISDKSWIFS